MNVHFSYFHIYGCSVFKGTFLVMRVGGVEYFLAPYNLGGQVGALWAGACLSTTSICPVEQKSECHLGLCLFP